MENIIKSFASFFAKESTMRIAYIITVVLFGINIVFKGFIPLYSLMICDGMFLLCLVFLYRSFKRHNKNVQKGLIGAVLMWYLYDEVNYVLSGIVFNDAVFTEYSNAAGMAYIVLSIATMVLFAALFVNHFIINSDHHSRPMNVFINQLLIIAIAVISILSIPMQVSVLMGQGLCSVGEAITWHTGLAALVILIASYEARLDGYRIAREEAGWTEEAGYPEGYVHEYEKNM